MTRTLVFARRNALEILRDPLTLVFGLGFPLVLLGLMTLIQSHIPVSLFELEHLTPGILVFGLAFMALFTAQLVARDRSTALLLRLYTTPLAPYEYLAGYLLPVLPISLAQAVTTLAASLLLGLAPSWNMLLVLLSLLPCALFFISLGFACGASMTDKMVGGFCGALLTNLTAWLSGAWFDLSLIGGAFETVCRALPFLNAVEALQSLLAGDYAAALLPLAIVIAYAAATLLLGGWLFLRQMKNR